MIATYQQECIRLHFCLRRRDFEIFIFIPDMIERMLQRAIKISILRCHIEQSVAREASHSAPVSALLVRLDPLLAIVATRCRLAALVRSLDNAILPGVFFMVSN